MVEGDTVKVLRIIPQEYDYVFIKLTATEISNFIRFVGCVGRIVAEDNFPFHPFLVKFAASRLPERFGVNELEVVRR